VAFLLVLRHRGRRPDHGGCAQLPDDHHGGRACAAGTSDVPVALLDVPDWLKTVSRTERTLPDGSTAYATKVGRPTRSRSRSTAPGRTAYSGSAGRLVYNAPMDLSTWSARMAIRESIDDVMPLVSFTSADGTITLGADGKVELVLSATDTDALDFSAGVYDLELLDPITAEVTRLASGKVKLSPQVTR
jgi:hypothetical protein